MTSHKLGVCALILLTVSVWSGTAIHAQTDSQPNPYQGTYIGTETLEGGEYKSAGTYPFEIHVHADGSITYIRDNDPGYGKLAGNKFYITRSSPIQVVQGVVSGKTISGTITRNTFIGNGTFSVTMEE